MEGREAHGARHLIGKKEGCWNAFLLKPSSQPLNGRPREAEHENVVRRDSPFDTCLDPRLSEPAGHGQRRMAMDLRGWPISQSSVGHHVVVRPGGSDART